MIHNLALAASVFGILVPSHHAPHHHFTPAVHAPVHHHRAYHPYHRHHAPLRNATIYDSTTPSSIPSHSNVAVYATGPYHAENSQLHQFHRKLWIDTQGGDPKANALDVEPGDATPSEAAVWAHHRLSEYPHGIARIYTMRSEWSAVKDAVATLPAHQRAHVKYWIADPTGVKHMVPGSSATQWYWGHGFDITEAAPGFTP